MSTRTGIFTVGVAGVYQLSFTAKYVSSSKGRFGAWSDVYVNNTVSNGRVVCRRSCELDARRHDC